jgi:hypothetical protein
MRTITPGSDEYSIQRFALSGGTITAAGGEPLPPCGGGQILTLEGSAWELAVNCPLSKSLRLLRFGTQVGGIDNFRDISVDSRGVSYSSGTNTLLAVTSGKQICRVALDSGKPECIRFKLANDRWIPMRGWAANGNTFYFGTGAGSRSSGMVTRIELVDIGPNSTLRSVNTTVPYWTFTVDPTGTGLYLTSPDQGKVSVVDSNGLNEKQIPLPGHYPTLVIPVP